MIEANGKAQVYDVCVIGSGAAGGIAAQVLTAAGLEVIMIEAGPALNASADFKQHVWPYELPRRGYGPGGRGVEWMAPKGSFSIEGEPYTQAEGSKFLWFRSRVVGGRTNQWGRGVYRFSESDFKGHSIDGMGEDWPLSYAEVAPYYDKTERFIGVYGEPDGPDGNMMPPPKPRCTEMVIKRGCDKLGIPCRSARAAVLTRPHNGRPACHYCGQCNRGCTTASNFSSSQVCIPAAMATGRFTMITNAMARELLVGPTGRVESVLFIDKKTCGERRLRARAFVLAASACESARLLLNSKSALFPDGLANSSGTVGRYLTDSVGSACMGLFPELSKLPPHNHDGTGGMHLHIPWWKAGRDNGFLRGYKIEFGGGRRLPNVYEFHDICERSQGYGPSLKQQCRDFYGTAICLSALGEMIPNDFSYCDIDPATVDQYGIPALRFHFRWGENEIKMAGDMQESMRSIVEAAGGIYLGEQAYGISVGGECFHELGTVRMGKDPKTSVLNKFCQAHDTKNLFVTDGGCFVSASDKLPTLTIMALSWRASEYLAEKARRGDL